MRKTRRAALVAAMLCYLAGAILLLGVYEGPMDADAVMHTAPGDEVVIMGRLDAFNDPRLQEWKGDDHAVMMTTSVPATVVIRSNTPLPEDGRWIVRGMLDARIDLDGQAYLLIDADDVTAPLLLG